MERYEAYKDSGVEWIGEVPAGWKLMRISSLYSARNEKVSDKDYAPLSVTMQGIQPQLETAAKTQDGDNRKLVKKGDFAINSRSDRRGSCGISQYNGSVSLITNVLKPKDDSAMDMRFFGYLFKSEKFSDEYYRQGTGIADDLWSTNWSRMKNILVCCPNYSDQKVIADYLDEKTTEIDSIVFETERSIELLREYRKSVISEAVTKGLDPNVPMKDSGVEWIGEIPESWVCCKQKYALRLINGRAFSDSEFEEDGKYRILRVGNLFTNPEWYTSSLELEPEKYCENGDLLYSWSMSYGPVVWTGEKVIYHYHIWKVDLSENMERDYAKYYLIALTDYIVSEKHETTMSFLTMGVMKESDILVPPNSVQIEIAAFLDTKTSEIDALIADKERQVELLKEYRKSLISEAVTGKFKVPGVS